MENCGVTQCTVAEMPSPEERRPFKPFLGQRLVEWGIFKLPIIGVVGLYLAVQVKVAKEWQRDPKQLGRLGF